MGPDHERWEDAAGAYVLNALPEDECAAYEAHLAECPACRAEAAELRVAAHALPLSAPALRPPPALKARIMAEVEREAALLASASSAPRTEPAEAPSAAGASRGCRCPPLAFACAALVAGVVAGGLLFGGGDGDARDPVRVHDPAGLGGARRARRQGAIVVANNLPAARPGQGLHGLDPAPGPRARADVRALHAAPRRLRHRVGHRRPGRRRDRAGQHRAARRLDDADVTAVARSPTSRSGSSPRTSSSSAHSKRSSVSPAMRSAERLVRCGYSSGDRRLQ